MADELKPLGEELERIASTLSASARRRLARETAADVRRANAARIRANQTPDGNAMEPRKPAERNLRKPRLADQQRRRGRMFRRAVGKLRMRASPSNAELAFAGRAGAVLAVHHYGLRDRVSRESGAPEVDYPARPLLGLTPEDRARMLEKVARHLSGG